VIRSLIPFSRKKLISFSEVHSRTQIFRKSGLKAVSLVGFKSRNSPMSASILSRTCGEFTPKFCWHSFRSCCLRSCLRLCFVSVANGLGKELLLLVEEVDMMEERKFCQGADCGEEAEKAVAHPRMTRSWIRGRDDKNVAMAIVGLCDFLCCYCYC